jgi:hypothetical protein
MVEQLKLNLPPKMPKVSKIPQVPTVISDDTKVSRTIKFSDALTNQQSCTKIIELPRNRLKT